MSFIRNLMIGFSFTLVTGCAGEEYPQVIYQCIYQSLYGLSRSGDQKRMTPNEQTIKPEMPEMDYQQYRYQRDKRIEGGNDGT